MNYGIMQGRLLPAFKSQYQAHPLGYWDEEFKLAAVNGLKYIEFIIDSYLYNFNPLMNGEGIRKIKQCSDATGVVVKSICADIFMQWPIKKMETQEIKKYGEILETLISSSIILT